MDDLDAVLASLEHTETVLRPQASSAQEPEPQINSQIRAELNAGLDAVLNTELDAELDAELNSALSQLNPSEQHTLDSSLAAELDAELEAVFAPSQFDSLVPGGVVYNLGTKFDDVTAEMTVTLKIMYEFLNSIALLSKAKDKNTYQHTKARMDDLQKYYEKELSVEISAIFSRYGKLSPGQKSQMKELQIFQDFNQKNFELQKDYTDTMHQISEYLKTLQNQSSEPDDEDLLFETTNEKDQSTFDSKYKEITELIQSFEVQFKKVEEYIPKLKEIEKNPPINKNEVNELLDISKKLDQEFRHSLMNLEFRWVDLTGGIARNQISLTENSRQKAHDLVIKINDIRKRYNDVDFYLISYAIAIEKFATPEYQKKREEERKKFSEQLEDKRKKFDEENRKETKKHASTSSQISQDPKSFEIYLKQFGQTLVRHVYPPIAAPLWTSTTLHKLLTNQPITPNQPPTKSTKSTTQTQYTQPLQVYNRELAALCARLIHIISVSEHFPTLAALRFAVEMKHTSPLVAAAILPTPHVAPTRNASVEHPNLQAITKHLANESLSRLTRMADAEFMRQRVIVETHETPKKRNKETRKANKIHTRDMSDVKHGKKQVHTRSKHGHEEGIHNNEEIQQAQNDKRTSSIWNSYMPDFSGRAHKWVTKYTPWSEEKL